MKEDMYKKLGIQTMFPYLKPFDKYIFMQKRQITNQTETIQKDNRQCFVQ